MRSVLPCILRLQTGRPSTTKTQDDEDDKDGDDESHCLREHRSLWPGVRRGVAYLLEQRSFLRF